MKLIHIVENLDKGAVENWLVNVFLESRKLRPEWEWTFFCILGRPGRLDEKVKEAGGRIIYAPMSISQKKDFLFFLRKKLSEGKFDIIHAHHDFLSGFYMLASIGLPGRKIIHVHNNDEIIPVGSEKLRKLILPVFRRMAFYLSDDILAISENTKEEFRNGFTGRKPVFSVLYYGIQMDKFKKISDTREFRRANALPEESKILLYAGRMIREKNPLFVLEILSELLHLREDVYAVFVGKGDLEEEVLHKAEELKIRDRIRLIGWSDDIPGIMKSSDIMIFPRLEFPKEGLGLVVVESQCAGLPIFLTRGIVKDAIVLDEMAFFEELAAPEQWAKRIQKILNQGAPLSREASLERMLQSRFELTDATKNLVSIYEKKEKGYRLKIK